MAAVICEDSHLCFSKVPEPAHQTSHICFGKRYRPNFLPIEIAAVAATLGDAVDQLAILGKTLPTDKTAKWSEEFRDISERFGKPSQSSRKYPEMAGMWPPRTEAMLKVQRDRLFAETVLGGTLAELLEKGSFGSLRTSLDWQCAMQADELELLSRYQSGRECAERLAQQLRDEKRDILDQAEFWAEKHELLTSNLHDSHLTSGLTTEYARRWESARRDQHGLLLGREEQRLRDAREHLQDPEGPDEERVHAEMMRFLSKDTEVLKRELDHWTDLYDAEMMQRETDLIHMRSAREQQIEQHRQLKTERRHREDLVNEIAALREEYEEKQRAIANVAAIQSWWRGVSFRAGILKEKSGKKKKKKGKKKQGKKGKGKSPRKGKQI